MVEDVHVQLDAGLLWTGSVQQEEKSFKQQIGITFKQETSKMWSIALCGAATWTLGGSISGIAGKF